MDYSEVGVQALRRAAVRAHSHALWAVSAEVRQESRAAIETSKVRIARSRIEVARVRQTCRNLLIRRFTSRVRSAAT